MIRCFARLSGGAAFLATGLSVTAVAQDGAPPDCPQERAIYRPWGEEGPGPRLVFAPFPEFSLIDSEGNRLARFNIVISTGAGKSYVLETKSPGQEPSDLGAILTVEVAPDTDPPKAAAWDGISVDNSPASRNIWIDQFANWDWYDYSRRPGSSGRIGAGSLWELAGCQPETTSDK